MLTSTFIPLFDYFARSGGGGSSSGDSDGGSILFLIGYMPMHFIGSTLRRKSSNKVATISTQVLGWIIGIAYAVLWLVIWSNFLGFLIACAAIAGTGAGLYNWFGKLKHSKFIQNNLRAAAQKDRLWDEAALLDRASEVFALYQKDWTNQNSEAMKSYMTPHYHNHATLLVYALQLASRQNIVENPEITDRAVIYLNDSANNALDSVTVGISAQANDKLIDTRTNQVLFTDRSEFTEFWRFKRQGNQWMLDGLQQPTESKWVHNYPLEQFASDNGYYYSADMGWLLIPSRGQLFGDAKFGKSDINNHVIGLYKQQLLVQIYTYRPHVNDAASFLIAQVNVPKNYGSIVVRRKKPLQLFGIRGLEKVSTEWQQFNDKYEVFAASSEQATSFELLNPTYMEQLEAAPFEINIEVIDNVIYFYSDENSVSATQYQEMLRLLQLAFKEMKL